MRRLVLHAAILAAAVGCGDDGETPRIPPVDIGSGDAGVDTDDDSGSPAYEAPPGCNPLAAELDCTLPLPSDVFLRPGDGGAGDRLITMTPEAVVMGDDGTPVDPTVLHPADGWSVHPTVLALLPALPDESQLTFLTDDVTATLEPGSTTLIIDTETGQPVLHFAELDPRPEDPARRALIMRPLVRLEHARRYVVAIVGLDDASGAPIPAPEGFGHIRDRTAELDSATAALAERYDAEVFPVLEELGVVREDIVLAWDFTVRSEEDASGDLLAIRDDLIARLDEVPPAASMLGEIERDEEEGMRFMNLAIEVPYYLEGDAEPRHDICRTDGGVEPCGGTLSVPVYVGIPDAVWDDPSTPARVIHYGHGFFGGRTEIDKGPAVEFATATNTVLIGVDWYGFAQVDLASISEDIVSRPQIALRFVDRVHQAMANQIALTRAIQTTLPELVVNDSGATLYDSSEVYYYGLSNGHILGGAFLALSPDIKVAAVGAGGGAYTTIMFRSLNFLPLEFVLRQTISDALEQQKWAALAQLALDRIDPIQYAPWVLERPLPGARSDRRVLMQTGLGDVSVPFVAARLHARALGIPLMIPAARQVPAIDTVPYPSDSGFVEVDFGLPEPVPGTRQLFPDGPNEVHEGVRVQPAIIEQLDAFFRAGGQVTHTCDGACDPN